MSGETGSSKVYNEVRFHSFSPFKNIRFEALLTNTLFVFLFLSDITNVIHGSWAPSTQNLSVWYKSLSD